MTWSYPLAQRAGIFSLFLINDVGNLEMRRILRFPGKAYEDLLSSTSNGALNLFSRVGWVGFGMLNCVSGVCSDLEIQQVVEQFSYMSKIDFLVFLYS